MEGHLYGHVWINGHCNCCNMTLDEYERQSHPRLDAKDQRIAELEEEIDGDNANLAACNDALAQAQDEIRQWRAALVHLDKMVHKAEDNVAVMRRSGRNHDARLESHRLQGLRDAIGCFPALEADHER